MVRKGQCVRGARSLRTTVRESLDPPMVASGPIIKVLSVWSPRRPEVDIWVITKSRALQAVS